MGKITGSVTEASDKLRELQIEAAESFDAIQDEVVATLGQPAAGQGGSDPAASANAIAMHWGRIWFVGLRSLAVAADLQAKIANDLLMDSTVPGPGEQGEASVDQPVGDGTDGD